MASLIIVEHDNQQMSPSVAKVLTAALQLDNKATLLVVGYQCAAVAKQAAQLAGVDAVWLVDQPEYQSQLAEAVSRVVVAMAASFQYILAASSTYGKNVIPRIAACLDSAQVSDVTKIIDTCTVAHPIYAGNAIETVRMLDDIKLLTIRPTAFAAAAIATSPCVIESIVPETVPVKTRFVCHELTHSERPSLTTATRVVSGGRALQSAEKFQLIEALADTLGAAVGASRAAVDAGFVSNDYQVGQTGKIVAPELYIAVGISGAVQHLAGMQDSKTIVAINKDSDAPIFQVADYYLVGDLFEIVPAFINELKKTEAKGV